MRMKIEIDDQVAQTLIMLSLRLGLRERKNPEREWSPAEKVQHARAALLRLAETEHRRRQAILKTIET